MIPFGLFHAWLITENRNIEVRALELSPSSFTFRLAPCHQELMPSLKALKLVFYSPVKHTGAELYLVDYVIQEIESTPFFKTYQASILDVNFEKQAQALSQEYLEYIERRSSLLPEELSHAYYPVYPEDQEEQFHTDWASQQEAWGSKVMEAIGSSVSNLEDLGHKPLKDGALECESLEGKSSEGGALKSVSLECESLEGKSSEGGTLKIETLEYDTLELGVTLKYPSDLKDWLSMTPKAYLEKRLDQAHMTGHPLSKVKPSYVYVGDSCCPLLFPKANDYSDLITHCKKYQQKLVFQLAPMPESLLEQICEQLQYLNQLILKESYSCQIEVGDMGIFDYCTKLEGFEKVSKGPLLLKKKKDPRMKYTPIDRSEKDLWDYEFQNREYQQIKFQNKELQAIDLQNRKILDNNLLNMESLDLLDKTEDAVYLPYYQTNTGTFCPFQSIWEQGDRSRQSRILTCNRLCEKHKILYPTHLNMVGIGNSLYGFSKESLILGYRKIRKRIILNL